MPAFISRPNARFGDRIARGRGFAILYVGIMLLVAFGLVSLAVDMGRLRVARLQLSTAADSAAIAGVQKLPIVNHTAAKNSAVAIAAANTAIQGTGNAVTVTLQQANDIEIGLYRFSTQKFTKVGSSESGGYTVQTSDANAMHVTAWRSGARGTAVGLFFARAIGLNQMDVRGEATAVVTGSGGGFGFVGLDWVHMNGTTKTDSYNAAAGPYDKNNFNHNGTIASNGSITMVGTSDVWGDAHPGVDKTLNSNGNATVHGWTAPLEKPLVFPPKSVPGGLVQTKFNTLPRSGKTVLIGNGTGTAGNPQQIWLDKIDLKGNPNSLQGNGYLDIYVTGPVDMTGGSVFGSGSPPLPAKVTITVVGPYDVDIGGGGELYAHVYAPESDVRYHGTNKGGFYGWVIGKTLDIKGNSQLHYDESLNSPVGPLHASLVK